MKERERGSMQPVLCFVFYGCLVVWMWGFLFFIALVLLLSAYRENLVWSRCLADLLVYDIFLPDCNSGLSKQKNALKRN